MMIWVWLSIDVMAAACGIIYSVVLFDLVVYIIHKAPKSRVFTQLATTLAYFVLPIVYFYFSRWR